MIRVILGTISLAALVVFLVAPLYAIDLKPVQPAGPLQPVRPAMPSLVKPLPDLTVNQTYFVVIPPIVEGDLVGQTKLKFAVRNVGQAASGRFEVEIFCGSTAPSCPGGFNGYSSVPPLEPGGSYEIRWPPLVSPDQRWPAGNFTINVKIDPDNAVQEVGEVPGSGTPALNEHFWSFTVSLPVPTAPKGLRIPSGTSGLKTPQPSSPTGSLPAVGSQFTTPVERRGINPQPEPPMDPKLRPTPPAWPVSSQDTRSTSRARALDDGRLVEFGREGETYTARFILVEGGLGTIPDGSYRLQSGETFRVVNGKVDPGPMSRETPRREVQKALPDLEVNLTRPPRGPSAGNPVVPVMSISVTNYGSGSSPLTQLKVNCTTYSPTVTVDGREIPNPSMFPGFGGPKCREEIDTILVVPGLAPRDTVRYQWPEGFGGQWQPGGHAVRVVVDPGNVIEEDEDFMLFGNNEEWVRFVVE